jgi:hypothetical protein
VVVVNTQDLVTTSAGGATPLLCGHQFVVSFRSDVVLLFEVGLAVGLAHFVGMLHPPSAVVFVPLFEVGRPPPAMMFTPLLGIFV